MQWQSPQGRHERRSEKKDDQTVLFTVVQKAFASIRKLLARSRNSDTVIGELEMRAGKLNLWHVTRDAQAASDGAGFVGTALLFFSFRNRRRFQAHKRSVASEAFGIIKGLVGRGILVWIVTSCAGQSHVGWIVSTAGKHAIRLKADGDHTA
jgi:hypothetical protein